MTAHCVYLAVMEGEYEICHARQGDVEGKSILAYPTRDPGAARFLMEKKARALSRGKAHFTITPDWTPATIKDSGPAERVIATCWTWLEEE